MTRDLLALLCCPSCRADLTASNDAPRLETGHLSCQGCGTVYPIEGGVPRFVGSDGYVRSFSYEWTRWQRVQIDVAGGGESEETFAHKTGLSQADLAGRRVLDIGCGAGRFLDVASRWGAQAVGIDYSFAVDAAQANLGDRANVNVVQADVFALPFKPGVFDIVYSLGVLHHTKDTRGAFLQLPSLLREGGQLAVWLYYYPDRLYRAASDFWRSAISRLPHRAILAWSWLLCALLSGLYRRPFMQRSPWSLLPRLLPVAIHPRWRWRVLDTFDWYSPRYQDKNCDPLRVAGWCQQSAMRDVVFLPFPTSMRATRDTSGRLSLVRGLPDLRGKRLMIFGAGVGGRLAWGDIDAIGLGGQVVAVCDNDPEKTGHSLAGHTVRRFDGVDRQAYDYVIIASSGGAVAIAAQLRQAGLLAPDDFCTAADVAEHRSMIQLACAA